MGTYSYWIGNRKHANVIEWEETEVTGTNYPKVQTGEILWVDNHKNNFKFFVNDVASIIGKF